MSFKNQYQMNVVGNLFLPKDYKRNSKHPAVVVGHPMGAVKEQIANLYAAKMAEQGFVAVSLDLSFWGESEGQPRNVVAPDIYAEDFSAAADYLGTQSFVDPQRIGAIGICGSGSFVISAAKIDPRIKAVATVSMYDMGSANRNGLNHSTTLEQRKQAIVEAAEQRYVEFSGGETKYTGGTVHLAMFAWGALNSVIPVAWSTWQTRALADRPEGGGGLMVAAIQLSIMLGAGLGGFLLEQVSMAATFLGGAALLVLASLVVGKGERILPQGSAESVE